MDYNIQYTKTQIWNWLANIPDPEIPVITIDDLGVLRDATILHDKVVVTITPTYSGCPAMKAFEDDIMQTLKEKGIKNVEIKTVYHPPWTTDWLSKTAQQKLKDYGIAPPIKGTQDKGVLFSSKQPIQCPHCSATNTSLKSQFGSTACKALYVCNDCQESFQIHLK